MGNLLGPESADPRGPQPVASFGLVTEIVSRQDDDGVGESDRRQGRMGVITVDDQATVCRVEHVPAVGDLIRGEVTMRVERVRVARNGRVSIFARRLSAREP